MMMATVMAKVTAMAMGAATVMLGCIFLFSGIYFLDQKNRSCQDS
jgi:hypothetical protein